MSRIILTQLNIYPIKSCKGVSLQSARLEARGLEYDRRWMVVDQHCRFITQREMPRLALVSVAIHSGYLIVKAPNMEELRVPFVLPTGDSLSVIVWDDTVSAVDVGNEAATWFSRYLGAAAKLVYLSDSADRLAQRRG